MAEQPGSPAADSAAERPVYYRRSTIGSKAGWIVAGSFALVVLVILGYFIVFPPPSWRTPATADPELVKLGLPAVSAEVVLGELPAAPGNAADDYSSAVAVMETNLALIGKHIGEDDYDPDDEDDKKLRWNIPPEAMSVLQEIASHVQAGAQKADMKYSFVYSPKTFNVTYFYKPADELEKLTSVLDTLATTYFRQKKYAEAEAILKAEFTLGCHMMRERIRVDMGIRGLRVQDMALTGLRGLYLERVDALIKLKTADKDIQDFEKRLKGIKTYSDSLICLHRAWKDKRKILWNVRPEPGDVFYIIENDEDRAWRVQGLLGLGLIKFTAAGSRSDKRKIKKLVAKYSAGDDPYLAAAANAARDFTREEFNVIGSKKY